MTSTPRLQLLLQMLQDSPEDSFLLFAIAKEYENLGDTAQALDYYLRLQQADPGYVGLYYHLGKLYEQMEQPDAAMQAYDQGLVVAQSVGDRHAWSELSAARLNLDYA